MQDLVGFIARTLVDHPEQVQVSADPDDANRLMLEVSEEDLGQIIGRRGRTAKAIRVLLRAAKGVELDIAGGAEGSDSDDEEDDDEDLDDLASD
jgi:predicted RNA-binding protein YlqC (UPF0109 family)